LDLQKAVGKKEIWKSLGTADRNEARELAAPVLAQMQAEFTDLRNRREPTDADLQGAVWNHYRAELEHDRQERLSMPTQARIDAAKGQLAVDIATGKVPWSDDPLTQLDSSLDVLAVKDRAALAREFRAKRTAILRKHLASGETSYVEWKADDVIARDGLLIERDSPAYRDLCQRLQRAELEALERAAERDQGDWTGSPKDRLVRPPLHVVSDKIAAPGEAVMELYDRFQRDKPGAVTADTWKQNRGIVQRFAEFLGDDASARCITRKAVRDWKNELFKWPVKANDTAAFAGLSFTKVIEANEKIKKPTITAKTINKYLSALGGFSEWLLANDFITDDVMRGQYLELDKKKRTRFPFTAEQLQTIFASPVFGACAGHKREHESGVVKIRDWRFWIPLIALYTGARLGEIAQLLTDDVRQVHGVWCLHITREGGNGKSTKTDGSQRLVPMHSKLIEIGFLQYHAKMKRRKAKQLFEVQPDARGFFSGKPSSFFNDYFAAIGVKLDKSVNFHSFRHGIADAFRSAGYLDEQFACLLGHSKASTTGRYGILPEGVLAERVRMIEAVEYPGLNLSHIHA
jgi:integrase